MNVSERREPMEPLATDSHLDATPPRRFDRVVLFATVTMSTVGLAMIFALLADLQDKFGFPAWALGLITASSYLTSFIAFVWLSHYADRGHARAMLMLGGLVGGAAMVWIAFGSELWELVAAKAIVGLGEGVIVPAARRVALGWSDRPGRELATMFSAGVSGFVVGPVLGAFLAETFSLSIPFTVAALLSFLTIPFLARLRVPSVSEGRTSGNIFTLLRHPLVATGVLLGATQLISIGVLEAVWARLLTDLGASTTWIGVSFTVILLPFILLVPIGGRLADRYSPVRIGLIGVLLLVPIVYMYGVLTGLVGLVALGVVQTAATALISPSAGAAVVLGSPPERLAQGQGLLAAFGFMSAAVGAAGAGWAYGALGASGLFGLTSGAILVLVGVTFLVGRSTSDVPAI